MSLATSILSALADGPASVDELCSLCDCDDSYKVLRRLFELQTQRKVRRYRARFAGRLSVTWALVVPADSSCTVTTRVYDCIANFRGVTSSEIRVQLELPITTVTNILHRLEYRGVIRCCGSAIVYGTRSRIWEVTDRPHGHAKRTYRVPAEVVHQPIVRAFSDWLAEDARGCIQPAFRTRTLTGASIQEVTYEH